MNEKAVLQGQGFTANAAVYLNDQIVLRGFKTQAGFSNFNGFAS